MNGVGDLLRVRHDGGDEDRDERVDLVAVEHKAHRALKGLGGRAGDHVHGVAHRGFGRQERAQLCLERRGERG